MFSVATTARARLEQSWLNCGRCIGGRRDRRRRNQHGMTDQACRDDRIASNRNCEGNCPHPSQHLQNHVPRGDVRNVPKRADFMIKNEIPSRRDKLLHSDLSNKLRYSASAAKLFLFLMIGCTSILMTCCAELVPAGSCRSGWSIAS